MNIETLKGHIIVNPEGISLINTFKIGDSENCKTEFSYVTGLYYDKWEDKEKEGYTCIPVIMSLTYIK